MLRVLRIQDLAVVQSLEISFHEGFNAITGETGAGKSILIKALSLVMGGKASPQTIRKGAKGARLEAVFWPSCQHRALEILERLGIPYDHDEPQILLRRTILATGRSQSWINDVAVTSASLREVGEHLLDVFAQHENHRLLDVSAHLQYVDLFVEKSEAVDLVRGLFQTCREDYRKIVGLLEQFKKKARERDYLDFRCKEVETLGPSQEDYQQLIATSATIKSASKIGAAIAEAQSRIDGNSDNVSLCEQLWSLSRLLSGVAGANQDLMALANEAEGLAEAADNLSFRINQLQHSVDLSEEDCDRIEERLAEYQVLMRKLGVDDIEDLAKEMLRLREELGFLDTVGLEIKEHLSLLKQNCEKLNIAAKKLSKLRKDAAKRIKLMVEAELAELAMAGASLEVRLSSVENSQLALDLTSFDPACLALWEACAEVLTSVGELGAEKAQLFLASNPGESALPLQKIASGGEISRIMLAFKRALAAGAETCVLVFDEIDTGISGMIADVVGRKLRELSKNFQVICISHLAQVAAYGDSHFLVRKYQRAGRTESEITELDHEGSLREIARMLSGEEVTPSSLANAQELKLHANL